MNPQQQRIYTANDSDGGPSFAAIAPTAVAKEEASAPLDSTEGFSSACFKGHVLLLWPLSPQTPQHLIPLPHRRVPFPAELADLTISVSDAVRRKGTRGPSCKLTACTGPAVQSGSTLSTGTLGACSRLLEAFNSGAGLSRLDTENTSSGEDLVRCRRCASGGLSRLGADPMSSGADMVSCTCPAATSPVALPAPDLAPPGLLSTPLPPFPLPSPSSAFTLRPGLDRLTYPSAGQKFCRWPSWPHPLHRNTRPVISSLFFLRFSWLA